MQDWEQLASNVRGVLFLGTPHTGSGLAAIAKAISISIFSGVTTQIAHNDPHLRELNEWFQQNANGRNISIKTYFETKPTNGFIVVDASSANPGVEGCVPVAFDGNHLEICKPTSRLSPLYTGCCHFIEDSLKTRTETIEDSGDAAELQASVEAAIVDQYSFFTQRVDEDRLDLVQKLTLGNRQSEIPRALRFKEQFAKSFTRNQLQTSSTRHYLRVLAEVESRFNGHVYPEIVAGASPQSLYRDLSQKTSLVGLAAKGLIDPTAFQTGAAQLNAENVPTKLSLRIADANQSDASLVDFLVKQFATLGLLGPKGLRGVSRA